MDNVPKAKYRILNHLLGLMEYSQHPIIWSNLSREWGIDFRDVRVAAVLLHDAKAMEMYRYSPSTNPIWIPFKADEEDFYFSQGSNTEVKVLTRARSLLEPVKEEYLKSARSAVRAAEQHLALAKNVGDSAQRKKALEAAWHQYQQVCEELSGDPDPIPLPNALGSSQPSGEKNSTALHSAFDSYYPQSVIGQGGSGRVHNAKSQDGKSVAIKVLDAKSVKQSPDKLKRFKNELAFCSRALSPNIVPVLDHGFIDHHDIKLPFYVMPLYQKSLRNLLDQGIDKGKVLPLFSGLLAGIEAAHVQRVVHRDLKPENILYDAESDQLIVADFGIALFEEENLMTAVETRDNQRLANFTYAAPEQKIRGAEVDHRADIYALGLILNEMFTGIVPHGTNYKRISAVAPKLAHLDSLIDSMLRQEKEDRPQTVADVRSRLSANADSGTPPTPEPGGTATQIPAPSNSAPSSPYQSFLEQNKGKTILIEDQTIGDKNQFTIEAISPWDFTLLKHSNSTHYTIALSEIDYHQIVAGQIVLKMKKLWGDYQVAERMMSQKGR